MTEDKRQAGGARHVGIAIIEDNRYLREGWGAVLSSVSEFHVVGSYASCEEAFASDRLGESDVVLMDIGLPGMSGIEGVATLLRQHPEIAVIMCTVFDEDKKIFDALCNGAIGYLLKKIPAQEMIQAIKDAAAGGSPMTPNIARKVISSFQRPAAGGSGKQDNLTEREQEVLELLAQGQSYAAIGETLHLSVDGVRYHIRHIYEKLQVHSRGQAIAKGLKKRLIHPPR